MQSWCCYGRGIQLTRHGYDGFFRTIVSTTQAASAQGSGGGRALLAQGVRLPDHRATRHVAPRPAGYEDERLPPEAAEVWDRVIGANGENLTRAHAILLYERLDKDHVLGWASHHAKKPPDYAYYMKVKKEHPDKLLAMRMGKFYEFVGRDAVVAIELLNLNGMGLGAADDADDGAPSEDGSDEDAPGGAAAPAAAGDVPGYAQCPRAGYPAMCARTEAARLCRAGVDVVVCEQAPASQSSGKLLTRYIAQICTPHSPFYVWGDEAGEPAGLGISHLVIWGVAESGDGSWDLYTWDRGSYRREVWPGLSYEELTDRLETAASSDGLTLPVYVSVEPGRAAGAPLGPRAPSERGFSAGLLRFKEDLAQLYPRSLQLVKPIRGQPSAFVATVQKALEGFPDAAADFHRGQAPLSDLWHLADAHAGAGEASRPLRLAESTARALGLLSGDGGGGAPGGGAASLLSAVLGGDDGVVLRRRLRQLLLQPPPRGTCLDIAAAVRAWSEVEVDGPFEFSIIADLDHTMTKLFKAEVKTRDFVQLHRLLAVTIAALESPHAAAAVDRLLAVASSSVGLGREVSRGRLMAECSLLKDKLEEVVPLHAAKDLIDGTRKEFPKHEGLARLIWEMEKQKVDALVRRTVLPRPVAAELRDARKALEAALERSLQAFQDAVGEAPAAPGLEGDARLGSRDLGARSVRGERPAAHTRVAPKAGLYAVFDAEALTLGVHAPGAREVHRPSSTEHAAAGSGDTVLQLWAQQLGCVEGAIRSVGTDCWEPPELRAAMANYRDAVEIAHEAARDVITGLCAFMFTPAPSSDPLGRPGGPAAVAQSASGSGAEAGAAAEMGDDSALTRPLVCVLHDAKEVNEWGVLVSRVTNTYIRKAWTLPEMTEGGSDLVLNHLWPYWMDRPQSREPALRSTGSAVPNDVRMSDEMFVLTGPNMSGKSTLMRSVMAAALLGNVGLPVPANFASVPQLRSFLFRNFTGDSPLNNLSGYARECREMAAIQRVGSPRSAGGPRHLVCIDEYGKGTEDVSATALCCAALEFFDQQNYNGIFATHQHELFDGSLGFCDTLAHTRLKAMGTEEAPRGDGVPTYRATFSMEDGVCLRSFALQVALGEGIPRSVVDEAADIHRQLLLKRQLRMSAVVPNQYHSDAPTFRTSA